MRTSFFVAVTSLASMLALAAACSSSTTTVVSGDAGDDEADATTTKDAGKDTGTKDAGEKDSAPADPDEACYSQSASDCNNCCADNHTDGYDVYMGSIINCACKGTGASDSKPACATECEATLCAATPANPDKACNDCLDAALAKTGTCIGALQTDCTGSDACMSLISCAQNCPAQ